MLDEDHERVKTSEKLVSGSLSLDYFIIKLVPKLKCKHCWGVICMVVIYTIYNKSIFFLIRLLLIKENVSVSMFFFMLFLSGLEILEIIIRTSVDLGLSPR